MKILCLHGAYGSAKAFRTQLDPFVSVVEQSGAIEFKFVDGQFPTKTPPGFEDYFGPPPWYRNINFDGIDSLGAFVDNLRSNEDGETYEDTFRNLMTNDSSMFSETKSIDMTMEWIKRYLDEDPEIEGILGYSEGATAAASYLVREADLEADTGEPRRLKIGIFFAGWPPTRTRDGVTVPILADESEVLIEVPTCHIVGSTDPYLYGAMALHAVCDEDRATLFDHGKGHTVPRDATTIQELGEAIKKTIDSAHS